MNSEQRDMFGVAPEEEELPHNGTPTSRQAAKDAKPDASKMRQKVLDTIASRGAWGATDEEIQLLTGMNPSTVRPRRGELVKKGKVWKALDHEGKPMRRPTRSGSSAQVWRAR